MGPWLVAAVLVAIVSRSVRSVAFRRADRRHAARFRTMPSGITSGAEPFTLRHSGAPALLLLHGSGDTPQTMRYLGERLHAAGFTVHAPLLPGHGRTPSAFATADAGAYLDGARAGLDLLRREASWVGIIGLSMGGALAAQLVAESGDVRALGLLAPYLEPPRTVVWAARTGWLWGAVLPLLNARGEGSIQDVAARGDSRAYGLVTPRALAALLATAAAGHRALGRVTVPTLVIHSREDIRIPTAIAERSTSGLAGATERHWVTGCGHIITVDRCRREVADLVSEFFLRAASPV